MNGARQWLAAEDGDDRWLEEDGDSAPRLLVLVHRMAAIRLGFPNLYSSLNDRSPEDLKAGIVDGSAWVLRPFLSYVLPLVLARESGREFDVVRLLRKHCPLFQPDALAAERTAELLDQLQRDVDGLAERLQDESGVRIGDIVAYLRCRNLCSFDDRYLRLVDEFSVAEPVSIPATENASLRFMQCDATELWGYRRYIEKLSPFATQQGIKGTEFEKVLVVIDDEEGRSPSFSYGKYFGVTPLSDTDRDNLAQGNDSVVDRTRRLFYVCCSRALSDLAVVIFADDTVAMQQALVQKGFFDETDLYVLGSK